jgi:hypothetical protein
LFLTIVTVVVPVLGGVETVSRVEVRMDVTKTTLVEWTGGATIMRDKLVAAFEKSKISKVVVATVVGMMVIIVGVT